MKNFILCILVGLLSTSCSLVKVEAPEYSSLPVRDVPLTARKGNTYLKKLLVLPILSPHIGSETLAKIENNFIAKLGGTGFYDVIMPAEINLNPSAYITNENRYNIDKLTTAVKNSNVSAFVIVMVEDIKYYKVGDKLGVIRTIQNKLDAKTRIAIVSTGTKSDIYKTLKESSVVMSDQRTFTKPHTDTKAYADPYMVELAVTNALNEVVPVAHESLSNLAWEGRVARVEGEKVFLNVGRKSGVQIGDILKVTGKSADVFDPQKGEYIGKSPGRVKGTIEVQSYLGENGAIAVIHSGAGFQTNDKIEVY